PLQVGAARTPKPTILWLSVRASLLIFAFLTELFRALKIDFIYAPSNDLGSTLDFGVFCAARCCELVCFRLAVIAFFAAVFLHCCFLPRSGAHSAGRSKFNRRRCRWHRDGHHRIG